MLLVASRLPHIVGTARPNDYPSHPVASCTERNNQREISHEPAVLSSTRSLTFAPKGQPVENSWAPREGLLPGPLAVCAAGSAVAGQLDHLGTLKMARRFLPILIVLSSVATKTRFRPF